MRRKVIDTHIHIWDLEKARYEWLDGNTSILNRSYDILEFNTVRKEAGITHGLLVQAANHLEDTDAMLAICASEDWLLGTVGWLPLLDPGATALVLEEKYLKNPYFKGCRHLIHDETDARWLLQEPVLESLEILAKSGLPYDLVGVLPEHIKTILEVANKVPDLRIIFDHLNQPPIATGERFGHWGELMREAATHPQFYAKISGLGTASGNFTGWTKEDLTPYIAFALEIFGEDRCLCGGDWPVSLLAGSYQQVWEAYFYNLDTLLDAAGQQKVLFDNAVEFYGLQVVI